MGGVELGAYYELHCLAEEEDRIVMHPAELPDERAASDPGGRCLADGRRELDNATFAAEVRRVSGALVGLGVGRGDVVAVVLPNSVELVTIMFAAWRLGAALTPVNPALTRPEVQYQVSDSGARLVVADDASLSKVEGGVARVCVVDELPKRDGAAEVAPPRTEPDELALMVYTGGTTGRPKGVMLDHANLVATAAMIVDWFEMTAADRCLLVLPLFHVNGIMVSVVSPLVAGGCTVIAPRFDPKTFWDLVERVRPTFFSAVPTIYAMLTALPAEVRPDTASLRCVVCGAAPMPAAAIHAFEDRYGVSILEGYGQSEGTVVTTANSLEGFAQARDGGFAVASAGGPGRRRRRRAVAVRTGGRSDGAGSERDAGLSRKARGNGRDAAWRLASHRRSRPL